MKLKLYKPGKIRKEGTIQFELRKGGSGELELVVYDNEGGDYDYANRVLDITKYGIVIHQGLSEDCGLPLNGHGQAVQV